MKTSNECLPCMISQVLKTADRVGLEDKTELMRKTFLYLSKADFASISTPLLLGEIYELIKEESQNEDPYKDVRDFYNSMLLEKLPNIEDSINQKPDSFKEAVKLAILGNIIDFSPAHELALKDVQEVFEKNRNEELAIDQTGELRKEIQKADVILYLGDNCGEICLDKLLIKKIHILNPNAKIIFSTRGKPVVNDLIEEDAYKVGMNEYAAIINNGDASLGTVLNRTSSEFRYIYDKADLVISKGQGNYECLSDEKKNIYFLLMSKCKRIADDLEIAQKKMVCTTKNK